MVRRYLWAAPVCICMMANFVWAQAQTETWPRTNPIRPADASGPDQPVVPQVPTIERRAATDPGRQYAGQGQGGNQGQLQLPKERQLFPMSDQGAAMQPQQPQQPPPPPFTLTPQEEAQLDNVLRAWEQKSKDIKTFDCSFKRWEYDPVFPKPGADPNAPRDPNAPAYIEIGIIKYATPDKGVFDVRLQDGPDGKPVPVDPDRADHWICDGKSVFQYLPREKKLIEHKLPPEMQGKAIVDGPLPFLFGAEAQKLRQRYWIRVVPPPANVQGVVCLEAYPRFQQDAANFRTATLMLNVPAMAPRALQILQPNGRSRTSYEFYDVVFNDSLRLFQGDPFRAYMPRGWEKVVDDASAQQAGRMGGKKSR